MRRLQELLGTLDLQEAKLLDPSYDSAVVGVDIIGKRVIYNYNSLIEISKGLSDSVSAWKMVNDMISGPAEEHGPVIMSPLSVPSDVSGNVREIVEQFIERRSEDIEYSENLKLFEVLDSLDAVEIIMDIERRFQISIPDSIIENLKTPMALEIFIENALRKNKAL